VSENTVAALLAEQYLAAHRKKRRKGATRPGKTRWRVPDLVKRDFPASPIDRSGTATAPRSPRMKESSTWRRSWTWPPAGSWEFALGKRHDAQLAYGALAMAVAMRGGQAPGVIMHTDRAASTPPASSAQPASGFPAASRWAGPGSALDNAVIESWHSTLEFELRSLEHFATRAAARARVSAWIQDYNHHRRHSALQMMSPADYEKTLQAGEAA
jgi:putative transposase